MSDCDVDKASNVPTIEEIVDSYVMPLEQELEQLKARNAQMADALAFVRDNLKRNDNKGVGLSALVRLNKALSTPISQQYIKEQRAKDAVIEQVQFSFDNFGSGSIKLIKALDNLKEIEKGE